MKTFNSSSTRTIRKQLADALSTGTIEATDTVWKDDSGEYVVDNGHFAGVDTDDLSDSLREVGTVADYID